MKLLFFLSFFCNQSRNHRFSYSSLVFCSPILLTFSRWHSYSSFFSFFALMLMYIFSFYSIFYRPNFFSCSCSCFHLSLSFIHVDCDIDLYHFLSIMFNFHVRASFYFLVLFTLILKKIFKLIFFYTFSFFSCYCACFKCFSLSFLLILCRYWRFAVHIKHNCLLWNALKHLEIFIDKTFVLY